MYQNIDKTQIYYLYDYVTNKHTCIGTKDDLFRFLASAINTNNYEDPERWSNEYFNYSNFTMEDTYSIVKNDYIRDENDKIHWFSSKDFYIRRYVFYDGEYRLIDIRNFKDEIINENALLLN